MADYINIRGQSIEVVASDPANPTIGQIWYNSTSNTLKGGGFQVAAWATSNPLNTARIFLRGCGVQTAALGFGGIDTANTGATEEYDGSTWTSNPTGLNTARNVLAGAGTQAAALAFGGLDPVGTQTAATEEWTQAGVTGIKTITVS